MGSTLSLTGAITSAPGVIAEAKKPERVKKHVHGDGDP